MLVRPEGSHSTKYPGTSTLSLSWNNFITLCRLEKNKLALTSWDYLFWYNVLYHPRTNFYLRPYVLHVDLLNGTPYGLLILRHFMLLSYFKQGFKLSALTSHRVQLFSLFILLLVDEVESKSSVVRSTQQFHMRELSVQKFKALKMVECSISNTAAFA